MIHSHVATQVTTLVSAIRNILGDDVCVVLHGSVALGDYQPGRSDLDVLVFVSSMVTVIQQRLLTEAMLVVSGTPAPIEISVLDRALCDAWEHPAPFYFHYSEDWRNAMQDALGDVSHEWDVVRHDPDLSAHMIIAHHHGIVVYGTGVIPLPTPQQAMGAVWYDIADAEAQVCENPVYVILNLCRTLRWLMHGEVHSKGSGGKAMLNDLDGVAHNVVRTMLAHRRGLAVEIPECGVLQQVVRQLLVHIRTCMADKGFLANLL